MVSQGMVNLGFYGPQYTWSNKRQGQALIRERFDRGAANGEWRLLFPRATVRHCPHTSSDHAPILLDTFGDQSSGPHPFSFEAFWVSSPQCQDVFGDAWSHPCLGSSAFRVSQKIKRVKASLKRWNRESFGNIQQQIKLYHSELTNIQALTLPLLRKPKNKKCNGCCKRLYNVRKSCGSVNLAFSGSLWLN